MKAYDRPLTVWRLARLGAPSLAAIAIAFACNTGQLAQDSGDGGDGGDGGVPATRSAPTPRDFVPVPPAPSVPVEAPITGAAAVIVPPDGGTAVCPADMNDCGPVERERRCCPLGTMCFANTSSFACYPVCPADYPQLCIHFTGGFGPPTPSAPAASCCLSDGCQQVASSPYTRTNACLCPKTLPTLIGSTCFPACPADHPTLCGSECCAGPCQDSFGNAPRCGCNADAGSTQCGDGCCAGGQNCVGGECVTSGP
jgi:hypothetical protein